MALRSWRARVHGARDSSEYDEVIPARKGSASRCSSYRENAMRLKLIVPLVTAIYSFASGGALAHDESKSAAKPEKLGRVLFKTSCTPEAQKQFECSLGMLH